MIQKIFNPEINPEQLIYKTETPMKHEILQYNHLTSNQMYVL